MGKASRRKRSSDDATPSPANSWHRPEDLPLFYRFYGKARLSTFDIIVGMD
jgi:hypothetical protein